jgi:hypothetical protein
MAFGEYVRKKVSSVTTKEVFRFGVKGGCFGLLLFFCHQLLGASLFFMLFYLFGIVTGTASFALVASGSAVAVQVLLFTRPLSGPVPMETMLGAGQIAFTATALCFALGGRLVKRGVLPQGVACLLFWGMTGWFLAFALCRAIPAPFALSWSALCGIFYFAGRQPGIRVLPRFHRGMAINAAILVLSLLLSAALLETGIRLFLTVRPSTQALFLPDTEYMFTANPGGECEFVIPLEDGK